MAWGVTPDIQVLLIVDTNGTLPHNTPLRGFVHPSCRSPLDESVEGTQHYSQQKESRGTFCLKLRTSCNNPKEPTETERVHAQEEQILVGS